jgi:putative CocE/NonD family hydrolase
MVSGDVASALLDTIRVEQGVAVPMRDGTILRADVFHPRSPGRYPALVERTPYALALRADDGARFARHGYVYVAQNVRGRFGSGGAFHPWQDDGWGTNRDGFDTIEWAAAQPWSNGVVGMSGGSFAGCAAYLAAAARPPHLRALVVRQGMADPGGDTVYRGGVHQLGMLRDWILRAVLLPELEQASTPPELSARRERISGAHAQLERWLRHLPLRSFPPIEEAADWYFTWLARPQGSPYWRQVDVTRQVAAIDAPILHLGGWFDVFLDSTLRCFTGIRRHGRSAGCRSGQRLIVGPWDHWASGADRRFVGELDFGPPADLDFDAARLRWCDDWLKGEETATAHGAPVRIFLMGDNRWLDLEDWPPPGITYRRLYLRAGTGPTADSLNNGGLTFAPPAEAEAPDRFVYDPADPTPSLLRYPRTGPHDHRPIEGRLLTFTSAVLERDVTVIGPVRAVLYAASSAPDTDWVARLCDVWPDGRSMSVCDGILRARYRHSLEREELMVPGRVYRFEVDLRATAQVFKAGHRLRVQVTSSDFPRYARNLNTGGAPNEEARGTVATNTVMHDAGRASYIALPVVPAAPGPEGRDWP